MLLHHSCITYVVTTKRQTWAFIQTDGSEGVLREWIGYFPVELGIVDLLGWAERHTASIVIEVLASLQINGKRRSNKLIT